MQIMDCARMEFSSAAYEGEIEVEGGVESACRKCGSGSLQLQTAPGGRICLGCFVNLVTDPFFLVVHKEYALSHLFQALDDQQFRDAFLQHHRFLLASPLAFSICSCSDDALARDLTDVILKLCVLDLHDGAGILQEFLHHFCAKLGSSAIIWTSGQAYSLHCLGLVLDIQNDVVISTCNWVVKQKSLISNLVCGLELPSDSVQGEVLFVLFKLLHFENAVQEIIPFCPGLIRLAVDILLKAERDDIRTNCLAFLVVLAREEVFNICSEIPAKDCEMEIESLQTAKSSDELPKDDFVRHFAEAVKGPLLSSDIHVQIGTLELICWVCPTEKADLTNEICTLVEEGILDYIFEVLRLSGNMEPLLTWSIRTLSKLSVVEKIFTQRFSVGLPSLIQVLGCIAEITLHPAQTDVLILIGMFISRCPGIVSVVQVEELLLILTKMLNLHTLGTAGLSVPTFDASCLCFQFLLKSPSCFGIKASISSLVYEIVRNMVSSLSNNIIKLNAVSVLDIYRQVIFFAKHKKDDSELQISEESLVDICIIYLLPLVTSMCYNEETTVAILQTFSVIIQETSFLQSKFLAERLASVSWFTLSFELLACYPSCDVKHCIFFICSLLIDRLVEEGMGEFVREFLQDLPSDPVDLLFLLGQPCSSSNQLSRLQFAVISILYASYLNDERLVSDNQVLHLLEKYIIFSVSDSMYRLTNNYIIMQVLDLYACILENLDSSVSYCSEAEKLLLEIVRENDCDVFSARRLKAVLKHLFHHSEIHDFVLMQIKRLCICFHQIENDTSIELAQDHCETNNAVCSNIVVLMEVIKQENFGTFILASLLDQALHDYEEDQQAVLEFVMKTLSASQGAEYLLDADSIILSLRSFYFKTVPSEMMLIVNSIVFRILYWQKTTLIEDSWLPVTVQIMDLLLGKLKDKNSLSNEIVLLFSILSLVLQKCESGQGVLLEASRGICSNRRLGLAVESIIIDACSKASALSQLTEDTGGGQILVSSLIFYLFWRKCICNVLEKDARFEDTFFTDMMQNQNGTDSVSSVNPDNTFLTIKIHCSHLCKLLYFGSVMVKLVTVYCLVEVLSLIDSTILLEEPKSKLNCTPNYLHSVLMILQGFVVHENIFIAMNAAFCIYWLLKFDRYSDQQQRVLRNSNWYKFILEELTLSLALPSSTKHKYSSRAFPKPEAYVAIALLRLPSPPSWMISIFSPTCISSIVENLSSERIGPEIVLLLRLLLCNGCMDSSHISKLHCLFQDFRSFFYTQSLQHHQTQHQVEKITCCNSNYIKMTVSHIKFLDTDPIYSMYAHALEDGDYEKDFITRLLAELDQFLQESSEYL